MASVSSAAWVSRAGLPVEHERARPPRRTRAGCRSASRRPPGAARNRGRARRTRSASSAASSPSHARSTRVRPAPRERGGQRPDRRRPAASADHRAPPPARLEAPQGRTSTVDRSGSSPSVCAGPSATPRRCLGSTRARLGPRSRSTASRARPPTARSARLGHELTSAVVPGLRAVRPAVAGAASNSSSTTTSPSSAPVQRTVSSPSAVDLVEGDRALAEQLEQREEPRHHDQRVAARRRPAPGSVAERTRRSRSTTSAACSRTLTAGACRWSRPTVGSGRGSSARVAIAANCSGVSPSTSSGSSFGEPRLHRHRAREPARLHRQPLRQHRGDLLERPVLQQPGEQQVPRLQQREVLVVLDVARRQQPGRLEVEQGGRDHEELAGLVEIPLRAAGPDVGDELVGDPGQRDLGDVELVLGDQPEQQVERALEDVEVHLEARDARAARCAGSAPPTSSRRRGAASSPDSTDRPAGRRDPRASRVRPRRPGR